MLWILICYCIETFFILCFAEQCFLLSSKVAFFKYLVFKWMILHIALFKATWVLFDVWNLWSRNLITGCISSLWQKTHNLSDVLQEAPSHASKCGLNTLKFMKGVGSILDTLNTNSWEIECSLGYLYHICYSNCPYETKLVGKWYNPRQKNWSQSST